MEASVERHAAIAAALGVEAKESHVSTALAGADRLERLVAECGVSTDLGSYGLSVAAIPQMAASAATVTRLLRNNPREMDLADIEHIYRQCFTACP
jgi:alcohol dehydrogenase class IV